MTFNKASDDDNKKTNRLDGKQNNADNKKSGINKEKDAIMQWWQGNYCPEAADNLQRNEAQTWDYKRVSGAIWGE